MGKVYNAIDDKIRDWIGRQHMFFVATAPLVGDGHVNCSPKGVHTLRVVDAHTLAYLDFPGSGIETVAHVRENGRIVIMLCAFEGPPKIYRFHGFGEVIAPTDGEFTALYDLFDKDELMPRAIVRVRVTRIADSCGFGVPRYDFVAQRDASYKYAHQMGRDKIVGYLGEYNSKSLDGLPGLSGAEIAAYPEPAVTDS